MPQHQHCSALQLILTRGLVSTALLSIIWLTLTNSNPAGWRGGSLSNPTIRNPVLGVVAYERFKILTYKTTL
jgi:hypothetical protein